MSNSLTFHKNKKPHSNMKMRNKGKVYPSTSSTTTTTTTSQPDGDYLSVLNLLPAAILSLAVVLSLEDREVLAYMITRSIQSTNPSYFENKKNNNNKSTIVNNNISHKSPLFECDCFDCYTNFWYKWDSSPNRELIHQAIEAFEESLTNNEHSKKRTKKKDKMAHRRLAGKHHSPAAESSPSVVVQVLQQEYEVLPFDEKVQEIVEEQNGVLGNVVEEMPESPEMAVVVRPAAAGQNKGLARKVLPDVIGLFNWRLFSLWSPNV
uniref:uncharacterized protein LOC122583132 n=1 Tax=Erigeron canadensis TaxID=72917 RepID=UPI001CB8A560|nr:uncharacterized protein LOC122583132 [Erigeron canadensis]